MTMLIANRLYELFIRIVNKIMEVTLWENILYVAAKIIFLLILAKIIMRLGSIMIQRIRSNKVIKLDERRTRTLTVLITNILRYVVYIFVGLSILEQLNFPIQTLLAGAGLIVLRSVLVQETLFKM